MKTPTTSLYLRWLAVGATLMSLVLSASRADEPKPPLPPPLPATLFFTWSGDPTTTSTVVWLSRDRGRPEVSIRADRPDGIWRRVFGQRVPFGETDINVARVFVDGLAPDSVYRVRSGEPGVEYRIRTAPHRTTSPIRFVAGGAPGPSDTTRVINRLAAARSPRFALLGGDLAYANGREPARWVEFLQIWNETMVTPEGLAVPMVVAIGNHEVDNTQPFGRGAAPYFYALFQQFREHGHATLDFGEIMSLVLLDSGHTTKVEGDQSAWLENVLEARSDVPHLFVSYHVPAYPSVRPFAGATSRLIREHWIPLFAAHGVDTVFENHDHAYKRAKSQDGVLYLGDGAWGATRRPVHRQGRDYLESLLSVNHFIETDIRGPNRIHRAIDRRGRVVDSVPELPIRVSVSGESQLLFGEERLAAGREISITIECVSSSVLGSAVTQVSGTIASRGRLDAFRELTPFVVDASSRTTIAVPWPEPGRFELSIHGAVSLESGETLELGRSHLTRFDVIAFEPVVGVAATSRPGVGYRAYHGKWRTIPDFAQTAVVASGTVPTITLAGTQPRPDAFGVEFDGLIRVDRSGAHRFVIDSADGSALWIHETLVVANSGRRDESRAESGVIFLQSGYHPFRLRYFDAGGVEYLELRHQWPGAAEATPIDPGRLRLKAADPDPKRGQ